MDNGQPISHVHLFHFPSSRFSSSEVLMGLDSFVASGLCCLFQILDRTRPWASPAVVMLQPYCDGRRSNLHTEWHPPALRSAGMYDDLNPGQNDTSKPSLGWRQRQPTGFFKWTPLRLAPFYYFGRPKVKPTNYELLISDGAKREGLRLSCPTP